VTSTPDADPQQTWVLVPVKTFAEAKTRLNHRVSAKQRPRLARAMLLDVLDSVISAEQIAGVVVISAEPEMATIADARGIMLLEEAAPRHLNQALRTGLGWLATQPACAQVVILPADVPFVRPQDIDELVEFADRHVTLTPSRDDEGTNAVVVQRPFDFRPEFGVDSFRRHLNGYARRGVTPRVFRNPRIALDVDTYEDIRQARRRAFCGAAHLENALRELCRPQNS